MTVLLARILGIIGLILITAGVLARTQKVQDVLFIFGGIGLLLYSISLRDPIFVPLQIIFVLAAAYDLFIKEKKRTA